MCQDQLMFMSSLHKLVSNLSSQFHPVIPKHAAAYVHHMIAYLCPLGYNLPPNLSIKCFDTGRHDVFSPCRSNEVIGSWAVGGEVSSAQTRRNTIPEPEPGSFSLLSQDFAFPEGIALTIEGGDTSLRYVVLEMHYDNPDQVGGVSVILNYL